MTANEKALYYVRIFGDTENAMYCAAMIVNLKDWLPKKEFDYHCEVYRILKAYHLEETKLIDQANKLIDEN